MYGSRLRLQLELEILDDDFHLLAVGRWLAVYQPEVEPYVLAPGREVRAGILPGLERLTLRAGTCEGDPAGSPVEGMPGLICSLEGEPVPVAGMLMRLHDVLSVG